MYERGVCGHGGVCEVGEHVEWEESAERESELLEHVEWEESG